MPNARKKLLTFAAGVIAIPVTVASIAYACQVLATLSVSPTAGPTGTSVTATGGNYSTSATASDVVIRLDSRTAPGIASTRPGPDRKISVSFNLPAGTARGTHTVLATQYNADGTPVAGTPGRASFKVTAAGTVAAASGSASIAHLTPVAVGLSLLLLLGVAVVRRRPSAQRS